MGGHFERLAAPRMASARPHTRSKERPGAIKPHERIGRVSSVSAAPAESVAVAWRLHDWQARPAIRTGRVLMRDELDSRHTGLRRVFWLLDEGVQLIYEPFGWTGEWYVDAVRIEARRDGGQLTYHVTDEYADIIVEGMGPTYRVIDLDQLADAMSAGSIDPAQAAVALRRVQRFADLYLHRGGPFPPPQIREFFAPDHHYPPLPHPAPAGGEPPAASGHGPGAGLAPPDRTRSVISIVPYDVRWPRRFAELADRLRGALGDVALRIDHIGSTAVPALAAKPVVDIQISVAALDPVGPFREPLQRLGYVYRAGNTERTKRYFREPPGAPRTHIHVRRAGSFSEQFPLLFRDYLRTHADEAAAYETLKRRLAAQFGHDGAAYTNAKVPFFWDVIRRADQWSQQSGWEPGPSDA